MLLHESAAWCPQMDLNHRPLSYQDSALTKLSYAGIGVIVHFFNSTTMSMHHAHRTVNQCDTNYSSAVCIMSSPSIV